VLTVSLGDWELGNSQWWATVIFKVTTLRLPLLKKKNIKVNATTTSKKKVF